MSKISLKNILKKTFNKNKKKKSVKKVSKKKAAHPKIRPKKILKPKKWSREAPRYHITLNDVKFNDLNREQYQLLFKLKMDE